jgi:hypothetical protein
VAWASRLPRGLRGEAVGPLSVLLEFGQTLGERVVLDERGSSRTQWRERQWGRRFVGGGDASALDEELDRPADLGQDPGVRSVPDAELEQRDRVVEDGELCTQLLIGCSAVVVVQDR